MCCVQKEKFLTMYDVCLIFDEMYFWKCQEYFGGEIIGGDDEGEFYKGIVCFIIVSLKELIAYVIKSSPETNIDVSWFKLELLDSFKIFSNCGFRVRAIFCENHHSMCLVSKNRWNMSTRIQMNYICYTSPEKSINWIQNWREKKFPNCEKFTLTSQTTLAFLRTLKCYDSLIEDLHAEGNETLLHRVDLSRCSDEMVTLSKEIREVANYIAGYETKKLKESFGDCFNILLTCG